MPRQIFNSLEEQDLYCEKLAKNGVTESGTFASVTTTGTHIGVMSLTKVGKVMMPKFIVLEYKNKEGKQMFSRGVLCDNVKPELSTDEKAALNDIFAAITDKVKDILSEPTSYKKSLELMSKESNGKFYLSVIGVN